jgi:hypothetical protein
VTALPQLPVQVIQHDIRQGRRQRRTLRGPLRRRLPDPAGHHPGLQIAPDELQDLAVIHLARHPRHQHTGTEPGRRTGPGRCPRPTPGRRRCTAARPAPPGSRTGRDGTRTRTRRRTGRRRSPPPGPGITTRRAGDGRYVPASRACRTGAQCSRSHGTSSSVVVPSAPGAPPLALTRHDARPRFSAESSRSRNETSRPGTTASPGRAGRPLRSAAGLNGTHRLLPAAGPHPRDGCDPRDQHEQHRFLRLT